MSCMAHIHLETIMKTLSNIITYLVMNSCHTYTLSENGFSQLFASIFCLDLMIFLSNCLSSTIFLDCGTGDATVPRTWLRITGGGQRWEEDQLCELR